MANGNPLFNQKAFEQTCNRSLRIGEEMTLQGTINKTFFLLLLCVVSGILSWNHSQAVAAHIFGISLASFVVGLIIVFQKTAAPLLAPLYAIGQGICLGAVSAMYNAQYHGIVAQAVVITLLVFGIMLFIYRSGLIKVDRKFMIAITAATGAIALFYLISWGLMLFGIPVAYFTSNSGTAIAVNVIICLVAAFNFLVDFKFIDQCTSEIIAPKYMEWYAGFALMVTLIWLYVEILRLLARSRRR